jgi:hypothetical protein
MSAAETLDISGLVFVNWANDEYEISSISDDDYTISSGKGISQIDKLDLDASYVDLSSYTSKGTIEAREYDLSILLNLFSDYPDLKENDSYFPHLFLDSSISRTSIMILVVIAVGIFSFLLSSITMISKMDVIMPIQSQQALINAAPLIDLQRTQICPINTVEMIHTENLIVDDDIKQSKEESIPNKEPKKNMESRKPWSLRILFRLLKLGKNLMIKAQVYIRRRLYQLRRDIRVLLGKNQ